MKTSRQTKRSHDFHLSYSRDGAPRISISLGRCKSRAVVLNGAFAAMLVDLAERIEKADAEAKGRV